MKQFISRRKFIVGSATLAGAAITSNIIGAPAIIRSLGKPNSLFKGVQIGTITYSFRSMPTDAENILKYCLDANVSAIELMGNTAEQFAGAPDQPNLSKEEKAVLLADWRKGLSMEKFKQLAEMYKKAGVSIYAYKPNAFSPSNTDAEVHYGMKAAQALGASHVTLEIPKEAGQTKRLSDIAAKFNMLVAYHGHEQQTPTIWDSALSESKYNALNCDLGHYTAAGYNAVELVKAKHDRIASAHLKDRQNKEHGRANLPWGTGDTPLVEVLQLMKKNSYKFPGTVELEYEIPAGSDAVKEVAKCVEYCKKALGA